MPESPSAFLVQFDQAETATSQSLSDVLARLTHEMAEPLSAIESIAYYLRMVLPKEDERAHSHLERIEELVGAANGTLGDALQYLRATPSEPEVLDLHVLIGEALLEHRRYSRAAFHVQLPDRPALIRVDASQGRHLLRCLFNLFRGLSKRCEEVYLRTFTENLIVTLEFKAVGLAATREEVESMFEPFGRGFAEGTGLALASARQIVEANGGRVSARSDNGRDLSLQGAFPLAS